MKPVKLIFSRYRAFKEETHLNLAPLTIIIGKNGGGKSLLTRLPLLMASGLDHRAEAPLDLGAGGVSHATRYEDLIYQRSAQPFMIGAEIEADGKAFQFKTTMRHIVETHQLAVEEFELSQNGAPVVQLKLDSPEELGKPNPVFVEHQPGTFFDANVHPRFDGLFPKAFGNGELTRRVNLIRQHFENTFGTASYLGPFRTEGGALARIPRQGISSLGPRGEFVLDVLGDDALRGEGRLVAKVESWFQDNMDGNRVKLVNNGGLPRLQVFDKLRNLDVDIAETGAGFAQVLPIVVQSISTAMLRRPLSIVEQPELHLHPAAHGAVADLIISAVVAGKGNIRYLCETHSEQFITRIRRRIAEGILPSDAVTVVSLNHQATLTADVEPIRTIKLDDNGNPDAWPVGVFDEAFDDLVHLREASRKRDAKGS